MEAVKMILNIAQIVMNVVLIVCIIQFKSNNKQEYRNMANNNSNNDTKEKVEIVMSDFIKLPRDCKFFIYGYMTAVQQSRNCSEQERTAQGW